MQSDEIVQRAIDYIEDHLFDDLALEQIAAAAAMSVPNLYRMFYAMTGHPIKEYIRKRRTSEASSLLRQTDLPANEIGFRCGFDNYQTFIKSFKRSTGLTPGLYRQAELIFSFERISLYERVTYFEEREVSERYSDVKVIRLAPQKGISYLYTSHKENGLEEAALDQFRALINKNEIDISSLRLFGWNVDLEGSPYPYGYQVAAISDRENFANHPDLKPIELPGGLYAVVRTQAGSAHTIVAAWNRLLSDWLPRSTFELGEHGLLDEYQQFCGQISRLKLYLPIRRRQETETIEIMERQSIKVMSFRAEGVDRILRADEASVEWINRNDLVGDSRLQLFMSCSFPPDDSPMYEVYIAPPEGFIPAREDVPRMTQLEGGLYACLTTKAYGLMTGVLERIFRWLATSSEYEPDGERTWYAHYIHSENMMTEESIPWSVTVECCVPVILRKSKPEVSS